MVLVISRWRRDQSRLHRKTALRADSSEFVHDSAPAGVLRCNDATKLIERILRRRCLTSRVVNVAPGVFAIRTPSGSVGAGQVI